MTSKELVQYFKSTLSSEKIQLDNLDRAKLVFNNKGEVVVQNEHGVQFSVEELSEDEINTFYDAIEFYSNN